MDNYSLLAIKDRAEIEFLNLLAESVFDDSAELTLLTESINSILDSYQTKYSVLLESMSELDDFNKQLSDANSESDDDKKLNIFNKIINSFKNAISWYYKVDPAKKLPVFRIILRMLIKTLITLIGVRSVKDTKVRFMGKVIRNADGKAIRTANRPVRLLAKKLPGSEQLVGAGRITKHITKTAVAKIALIMLIQKIVIPLIEKLDKHVLISYNKKDIDATIKDLDAAIDTFNEILNDDELDDASVRELKKTISKYQTALTELIDIKKTITADADKKIEKQQKKLDKKETK